MTRYKDLPIYDVHDDNLKKYFSRNGVSEANRSEVLPSDEYMRGGGVLYTDSNLPTEHDQQIRPTRISQIDMVLNKHKAKLACPAGEKVDDLRGTVVRKGLVGTIYNRYSSKEYTIDDFEIIHTLGRGAFGTVSLVKKLDDDSAYAMKQMKKKFILQNDLRENVIMEKQILFHNKHPFMVGMDSVFQDEDNVYFILDFIPGGELFTHLKKKKRFNEDTAKFYAMQIASALGYLHKKKLIYRDLKPENILLHEDGYIKLTDFGLAK